MLTEAELAQKITSGKAAILFIDVQDYFIEPSNNAPSGFLIKNPDCIQSDLIGGCEQAIKKASGRIKCLHIGYIEKQPNAEQRKERRFRLSAPRYINGTGLCAKELRRANLVSQFSYVIPRGHKIVLKSSTDAFAKTLLLQQQLDEWGIDTVILAGVFAAFCVRDTALGAQKLRLNIAFASDLIRCKKNALTCSDDDGERLKIHEDMFEGIGLVTSSEHIFNALDSMPRLAKRSFRSAVQKPVI
jgi:nicotinamidase-related amidase